MDDKIRATLDRLDGYEDYAREPLRGANGELGVLRGELCAACGWPWKWHTGRNCMFGSKKPDFVSTGKIVWAQNGQIHVAWISPAHEAAYLRKQEAPIEESLVVLMGTVAGL